MLRESFISADEYCIYHKIEFSFLKNLCEFGLLETVVINEINYIPENQLDKLERMLRLHRELNINLEGIDTIDNLLSKLEDLQQEVIRLKNRLRLYEDLD